MAFEPNYEKVVASYRVKGGVTQSVIECKLPSTDDKQVGKVLCANAKAYITASEIVGRDVNFSGFVSFQVGYTTPDGQVVGMDYTAEFKDKYILNTEYKIATPVVTVSVVDTSSMVTGGDVKVVAIVETNVDVIVTNDVNVLTGFNGGDVYSQNQTITYTTYAGMAYDKIDGIYDIQIKDGVSKVLSVCSNAFVTKIEPFNNYLKLTGGINLDICYLTDGENPQVRSMQSQVALDGEVALEGLNTESNVQSVVDISYDDVKITTSIDTNDATINMVIPVIYRGYVFNTREIEVVDDLFSVTNFTTTTTESLLTIANFQNLSTTEKLDGNVVLDETAPFIDEVLGTCCNSVVMANSTVTDGDLVVEGVAHVTVLYLNKELNNINSVEVEMPFSLTLNGDYSNNAESITHLSLGDITARSRRGKEIDVTGVLYIYSNLYSDKSEAVISRVELEDEIPESECALSVYIAKQGDTVWDIAKELSVSPDMILEQNPELPLPIPAGSHVVVYRQRLVNFD